MKVQSWLVALTSAALGMSALVCAPASAMQVATSTNVQRLDSGVIPRWDPCGGPITFQVNTSGLPVKKRAAAIREARWAVAELARPTGLPFAYTGETSYIPAAGGRKAESGVRTADIVIGYLTARQVPALGRGSSGLGGSPHVGSNGHRFDGYALIDGPGTLKKKWTRDRRKGGWSRPSAVLHELGHVVGLDHVTSRRQIMVRGKMPARWGSGDLTGLRQVGASHGCVPEETLWG